MKISKIGYLLFLLVCFLASCSQPHPEYAIPQKSVAVLELDLKSIFHKANLSDSLIDRQAWLQHPLKNMLKHPEKVGIDWRQRVFFYIDQNTPGVVASVHDEDLLTTSLQDLGFKVVADEDFHWATGHDIFLGYTDDLLIGTTQYADVKLLQKQVRKQVAQDETNSFVATQHFQRMQDDLQDMSLYFSASILTNWFGKVASFGPDVDMHQLSGFMTFNFEQDVAKLGLRIYGNNAKGQELLDQIKNTCTQLSGDFISQAPSNIAACVAISTCAKDVMNMLKRDRSLGFGITMAAQLLPIGDVLQNIEGELAAFATPQSRMPSVMLTAQMKDNEVLRQTAAWTQNEAGIRIQAVQPGHYALSAGWGNWYFGELGLGMYLSNDDKWASADTNPVLHSYQEQVKGAFAFAWADIQPWITWQAIPPIVQPALQQLGHVSLLAPDILTYQIQIHAAQEGQNLLHDLITIF